MDPVSVDLPETDFLQGWGVPWLVPLSPSPSAGSDVWSTRPRCSALLFFVHGRGTGMSLPVLFYFLSSSARV